MASHPVKSYVVPLVSLGFNWIVAVAVPALVAPASTKATLWAPTSSSGAAVSMVSARAAEAAPTLSAASVAVAAEGFYTDRNMASGNGEILVTEDVAIALRRITKRCCEWIARSAFELARSRNRHVTIVHKANVLKVSDGMFLDTCRSVAQAYPDVTTDDILIDAKMAHVVRTPARFDVVVTTNMYGDILSDLTAEFSGNLGMGGSLNAGSDHAMAQASHGSAPDIAGRDIANPISLILSTAQLLEWFGKRKSDARYVEAGIRISSAVEASVRTGKATRDIGGNLGTRAVGQAIAGQI